MQTTATHPNPFQTSGKMAAWCNIGLLIRLRSPHFFRIPLQVQVSILGGRYVRFDAWKVVCGRHVFSSFKPQAARNTKKNKDTKFQNNPSFRGLYEGKIVPLFFSSNYFILIEAVESCSMRVIVSPELGKLLICW